MTSPSGPARPQEPADSDGLPAAFAKEGAPYSLEELLSGLPPVESNGPVSPGEPAPAAERAAIDETAERAAIDETAERGAIDETAEASSAGPAPEPGPEPELEGVWDPTTLALNTIAAALQALSDETPQPAQQDPAAEDEGMLTLDEEYQAQPPTPAPAPIGSGGPEDLAARIEELITAHLPDGAVLEHKGDSALPQRLDALTFLLSEPPPADDFAALDALYACWPRTTQDCPSRALLAVAQNLSRNFGLPGKLPMASAKGWRMLSPLVFEAELALRLAEVGRFIADWQKTQRTFLILEFSEIELIECLFEALHLGHHAELLTEVMNFKVLSNRRMGLLRRIPGRVKKVIAPMLPEGKDRAMVELAHAKALLEQVAANSGFAPIIDTATKAREEIELSLIHI